MLRLHRFLVPLLPRTHDRQAMPSGGRSARTSAVLWGHRPHQEIRGSSQRRAVDHCQRAAPAHLGGPTRPLSRSTGEADRPQGQSWHDCTASFRALFGVTRLRGCHRQRGVVDVLSPITGIVAHNRRRYGRLSHITETRSTWHPERRLTKRENPFLQKVSYYCGVELLST
jgi:hypothetical protein